MSTIVQAIGLVLFVSSFWITGLRGADKEERKKTLEEKALDAASKKASEILAKLRSSASVIKKAGFEMGQVSVDVGIQPAVAVDFAMKKKVSEDEMKTLLEENKDNKILLAVLRTLSAVNKLDISGYKVEKITVVVSFPPKTTIVLTPTE